MSTDVEHASMILLLTESECRLTASKQIRINKSDNKNTRKHHMCGLRKYADHPMNIKINKQKECLNGTLIIGLTAWHHERIDDIGVFFTAPKSDHSDISAFDDVRLINKIIISTKLHWRQWFDIFAYYRRLRRLCENYLNSLAIFGGKFSPFSIRLDMFMFIHYSRPVNRTRTVSWIQIDLFKPRLHFSTIPFRFQSNGIKIDLIRCNMQCTCINCWTKTLFSNHTTSIDWSLRENYRLLSIQLHYKINYYQHTWLWMYTELND